MSLSSPVIQISNEVGGLLAAWLRRSYPDARAKRLARDFGVAEPTAKRWLAGNLPEAGTLLAMMQRWGAPFVAEVLAPTGGWTRAAVIERDLDNLGRSLDAARHMLLEAKRGRSQDPASVVETVAQ